MFTITLRRTHGNVEESKSRRVEAAVGVRRRRPPAGIHGVQSRQVHIFPTTIYRMKPWAALAVLLIVAILATATGIWFVRTRPIRTAAWVGVGTLPGGGARDRLNLVIVTLDTTRADRIGAYGSHEVETPAIDRLATEGVLFEQAVSAGPVTLPAHSSLFTGRFPPEHGVRDNGGFFLGADQLTLAEVLKSRGYRTGGFVAAYVLAGKWGINQGFDTYFDDFDLSHIRAVSLSAIQRPANEVLDKALPWIEQSSSAPFFAWIHLYDPHAPYRPPEPFEERRVG